jgi:hypothetical protein
MNSYRKELLGIFLFCVGQGLNAQTIDTGCANTAVLVPAGSQVIPETRPLIVWAGQQRAHVVLEARIPERELVQRIDTEVAGNSIKVAQELTNYRANVRVALNVPCGSSGKSDKEQTTNMRFYIDTGLACLPPAGLAVQEPGILAWSKTSTGDAVEVTLFRLSDWKEVARTRTSSTQYEMTGEKDTPLVAVARAVCGKNLSAPVFAYSAQ